MSASFTSSAGSTPDSRSRISQPSARTVSLTQNGIRHTHEQQCAGAAARHLGDDPGDRKGHQQGQRRGERRHDGGAHEHLPVERLGEECPVLQQARLVDVRRHALAAATGCASSTCGSTISANSHSNAGASNNVRISRRRQEAFSSGMRAGSFGGCFALCGSVPLARPLKQMARCGSKPKHDAFAHLEVGQAPGLRQRHAELEAAALLVEQHRGIGAVEQQALHLRR